MLDILLLEAIVDLVLVIRTVIDRHICIWNRKIDLTYQLVFKKNPLKLQGLLQLARIQSKYLRCCTCSILLQGFASAINTTEIIGKS